MTNILDYRSYYLVGIKGVAMTALAQCLVDAGKELRGSDVAEEFVTQKILNTLAIPIDFSFSTPVPNSAECVIYTAAHQARYNPQVQEAIQRGLPVVSQAEALAGLFNQKKGIAVCGVGGKSTTSAMIAWIFEFVARANNIPHQSFAVGVGNIPNLEKTGQWIAEPSSEYFVAEADEYVINPQAAQTGEAIIPRFSFLFPQMTVCTNMRFDHPDVYKNFSDTQLAYKAFFEQIRNDGVLIIHRDDLALATLAEKIAQEKSLKLVTFGNSTTADYSIQSFLSEEGKTYTQFVFGQQRYVLELLIPGEFNARNALAAIAAAQQSGIVIEDALAALKTFRSTMRRSEFIGVKQGVLYYDDYAHHPNEVKQVIHAFKEWYPKRKVVVVFQSHTFSRTKALLAEFSTAFTEADEVLMTDIFPSAREGVDLSISSDILCAAILQQTPTAVVKNMKTNTAVAEYCKTHLHEGDILLTIGAGDIYHIHEMIPT